MSRVPWIIAAASLALAGLLGWGYAAARRDRDAAEKSAEFERLERKKLQLIHDATKQQLDAALNRIVALDPAMKAQVDQIRAAAGLKLTVTGVEEGRTDDLEIGKVPRALEPAGATTPRVQPRASPRGMRPPRACNAEPVAAPAPGRSLAQATEPATTRDPGDLGTVARTEDLTIGSAPRSEERGEPGAVEKDVPALGAVPPVCALAEGDRAHIRVTRVTLSTERGNVIVAGTAALVRTKPPPEVPLVEGKLSIGSIALPPPPKPKQPGWGFGVHAGAFDGGRTIGPAVGLPAIPVFGHVLEAAVTVGVWPNWQASAIALARY